MDFQRRKPISFSYFGLMMIKHTELFSNIRYDKPPQYDTLLVEGYRQASGQMSILVHPSTGRPRQKSAAIRFQDPVHHRVGR